MRLIKCWLLGMIEFRSAFGRTYGHPWTDQSIAYDKGRDLAHKLTFRKFDQ